MAELTFEELHWKPHHNPWLVAITVTLATFMEVLDTSIANVALPHMAGSLGASQDEATWVLTSYLVSSAIVLPISGWLANRIGRKRFYMSCVAMFTVCSLLCGLAQTLPLLIFARVLQGLGGGGLATSEQAILADTFPIEKRGQAFALYGMAVVVAPAIGPTFGGWITDNFNWHWIFFINLPVGLLSLYLSNRMVEDPPFLKVRKEQAKHLKVDFMGLGLVALGVGLLEFTLDKGQEKDWFGDPMICATALISVCLLIFFAVWEWNHPDPIVDLKLLKNRNFGTAVFLQLILGMVLFGSTVLIPQYLQVLLGYTAERAGMVLSPAAFMMMIMMAVAGRTVGKMDPRLMVCMAYIGTALGVYNLTQLDLTTSFAHVTELRLLQVIALPFCVYSDQHAELCGCAGDQDEPDFEPVELCQEPGRERGDGAADDVHRADRAGAPVGAGGKRDFGERGVQRVYGPGEGDSDQARHVASGGRAGGDGRGLPGDGAAGNDAEL